MHWKDTAPVFEDVPDAYIPEELLTGLERYSEAGELTQIRLRWRPHSGGGAGFVTRNRLMNLQMATQLEVARAVTSYARHLWEQDQCERRFEAQVERAVPASDGRGRRREWRSITFYVSDPNPETDTTVTHDDIHDDDDADDLPDFDDDADDEPDHAPMFRPRASPAPRPPSSRPSPGPRRTRSLLQASGLGQYADFVELSRDDPNAFVLVMMERSHERTVGTLEQLLFGAFDRLDRIVESHSAQGTTINDALRTLTSGAGEVASIGLDLFRSGLDHQATAARIETDGKVDSERNEVVRGALSEGSKLVQAVIMSNAVKQRQSERERSPNQPVEREVRPPMPRGSAPPPGEGALDDEDAQLQAMEARYIESQARKLLEALTPDKLEQLRTHAPSIVAVFDHLRTRELTADWIRQVIRTAQTTADVSELAALQAHVPPEVSQRFQALLFRIMAGGLS